MRIETGTFGAGTDTSGWGLSQGSGPRSFDGIISFSQDFQVVPRVIIGLIQFDGNGSAVRVNTQVVQVNTNDFTVRFATSLDSLLFSATVSWLAFGD